MRRERGGSGEGGGRSYYTAEWQGREAEEENKTLREKVQVIPSHHLLSSLTHTTTSSPPTHTPPPPLLLPHTHHHLLSFSRTRTTFSPPTHTHLLSSPSHTPHPHTHTTYHPHTHHLLSSHTHTPSLPHTHLTLTLTLPTTLTHTTSSPPTHTHLPPSHTHTASQVSSLHFELAHQRVQLQGKLAEAEGTIRQLKEEAEEKVSLSVLPTESGNLDLCSHFIVGCTLLPEPGKRLPFVLAIKAPSQTLWLSESLGIRLMCLVSFPDTTPTHVATLHQIRYQKKMLTLFGSFVGIISLLEKDHK